MGNLKKFLTVLGVVGALALSTLGSFASEIGVVNLDDVLAGYSKAQDVSADLKVKEAELQKFLADAQKQLKDAATPVERKNLEAKLTDEFKQRSDSFRDLQAKQYKMLEDNVFAAIESVSKSKKLDVVLNKAGVLIGGTDITNDVLSTLNLKK